MAWKEPTMNSVQMSLKSGYGRKERRWTGCQNPTQSAVIVRIILNSKSFDYIRQN